MAKNQTNGKRVIAKSQLKKGAEKAKKKTSRPKIPDDVVLQLWARAAGQCEFEGCGKKLWRHGLTLQNINSSNIAHIVSFSKDGPRGDEIRSPLLATDISNLMLLCRDCHDLVDKKKYVAKYPEELLVEMKKVHEDRIDKAISMIPSKKSHALIFRSHMVNGNVPTPPTPTQVHEAMWLDRFPAIDQPLEINLTNGGVDIHDPKYMEHAITELGRRVNQIRETYDPQHFSVFALARIPLLVALGRKLGDKVGLDLYQLSNDKRHWKWDDGDQNPEPILLEEPEYNDADAETDVILKVEVSGSISARSVRKALPEPLPTYTIRVRKPGIGVISSTDQVVQFGSTVLNLLNKIPQLHGENARIHVFLAVPPPLAIELGRYHRTHFPSLLIYEWLPNEMWSFACEV